MLYARDKLGRLIEASKDAIAYCPSCGSRVQPKCGSIVTHHWAHISGDDCDTWSEPESPWHKEWKEHFPPHCREVVMGESNEHRADVCLDNGLVIELQHSSIRSEEIAKRERFYGSMVWMFDAREFIENCEIQTRSGIQLPLNGFLPVKNVDAAARIAKAELIKYKAKLVECTAALERVKARLINLPAKLLPTDEDGGAYQLINFFGGGRPGLKALTNAAQQHKKSIVEVLCQLPDKYDRNNAFFGLDPYSALKYIATGVPSRQDGERQYEWEKSVLPSATRESRMAIDQVAWFIHRNIQSNDTLKGTHTSGTQVIEAAIDNVGYFTAAAKLHADIEEAKLRTQPGANFQEIDLPLIKVPLFLSGLFATTALHISFIWKHRRKSLFNCKLPQCWDFGDDYLLFFENLSNQSNGANMTGLLITKEDFLRGVTQS